MSFLYNIATHISWFFLKIVALFNAKIKLFVTGRKETFSLLKKRLSKDDDVIWIHTASLGEFEQGLPIIEKIKTSYPSYKILVTFFSPSGYEVKKNTSSADIVTYLPMDTIGNAEKFIKTVQPKLAIFIKYEIWPNYFKSLAKNNIPLLLVSSIFRKKQIFFKGYGGFMKKALKQVSYFFVQDENSKQLLNSINLNNVLVSGDTRFDRVAEILKQDNHLDFMQSFKQNQFCLVAGSTWSEDEAILVNYINTSENTIKYVIAPHTINTKHIIELKQKNLKKTVLYSEMNVETISDFDVLIIDSVGLLTKIYSYANVAYVGGGFATGLHNTLEPAVFGIPVLIGPQYLGFKEAEDLVEKKGILVINNQTEFNSCLNELVQNESLHKKTGKINTDYISDNQGASIQIINHIRTLL